MNSDSMVLTLTVKRKKTSELNRAFENFKGAHELYWKGLVDVGRIKEAYDYFNAEYHAEKIEKM